MAHTIHTDLIDTTNDYAVLEAWKKRGWRITHISGDLYHAAKTIKVAL